ncbi:MAG: dienelactone hydrolase family protein [Betaproteobacteria bacterium]|nr:dienelactone hydrolase family protein [Betaproteobacteria bacterium]
MPDLYTRKADLDVQRHRRDHADRQQQQITTPARLRLSRHRRLRARERQGDLNRMAITGFCRGGRTTLVYAAENPAVEGGNGGVGRPVGGAANEFTPRTAMDRVAQNKVPTLGLYGAKDAGIPVEPVEKYFAALKAAGTPAELVVYPDAGHGFHADFRADNYRKADAEDAWKRMLAWFARHGAA